MSATTVFNAVSIPAGGSVSATFVATQPFRAVQIIMQQTMASVCPVGCKCSYAVSIDGGTTYSDPVALGHECNPSISGDTNKCSILLTETADHIRFVAYNASSVDCTSYTMQAEVFA